MDEIKYVKQFSLDIIQTTNSETGVIEFEYMLKIMNEFYVSESYARGAVRHFILGQEMLYEHFEGHTL